ncbi:MAG: hypothetical protein AB8F94_09170 [Saprospiraceae bacterium]
MKKQVSLLIVLGLFLFATPSKAQNYKSAVGLRLGYPLSVTYKQFVNESSAFEVYAGTRGFKGAANTGYRWFTVSGAYQIHKPIESVAGLDYYFGAGASIYFWSFEFDNNESSTSFGLQGYGGLSYTFSDTPINISVDWVPTFFINGYGSGFGAGYGSLAVRYVLSGGSNN